MVGPLQKVWARVERRCLHPDLFECPAELGRARLMLICCWFYCSSLVPLIFFAHAQDPDQVVVNTVVLGGHLAVMATFILLRYFPTTHAPVSAITLVATAQLIHAAFWSGGPQSVVLLVYPLAPVFFALVGRAVHALANGLSLVVSLGVMYLLEAQGFDFKTEGPTVEVYLLIMAWAILTGLFMASYSTHLRERAVERLVREQTQRSGAERAAVDAKDTRDWFLAYLNHEMRTPLSVISGGIDLLEGASEPSARHRQIQVLKVATASMARLMDDLADISGLELGGLRLKSDTMALDEVLVAVCAQFQQQATAKGLTLSTEIPDGPLMVRGDPDRVRQIVSNLVENAVKFTEAGGVFIEVEELDGEARIVVADTGPGIAEAHHEVVFEPYSRLELTSVPGTGLGLAIASRLAQKMGSNLFLESVEGEGTTFAFTLPIDPG